MNVIEYRLWFPKMVLFFILIKYIICLTKIKLIYCSITGLIILLICTIAFKNTITHSSSFKQYHLQSHRKVVPWLCFLGRLTYQAGGMKIVVRGKQASRAEAPILVVAPHSTFIDGGIVYVTGFPSIIVRRESGLNPFLGSMFLLIFCFNFCKNNPIIISESKYHKVQKLLFNLLNLIS